MRKQVVMVLIKACPEGTARLCQGGGERQQDGDSV